MLDLQKTGLPQIIDAMVKKLLEKKEVSSQTSLEEARHAIFTQDSGERDFVRWGGQPERSQQGRKSDFMSRNSRESKTECNCILKNIYVSNRIYMVSEPYF